MSNDRLYLALSKAGLTPEALADLVEVDVKTVRRWLSGRPPYSRHRAKVAQTLAVEEAELWPELAPRTPAEERSPELEGAWATPTEPGAPRWHKLITAARERIELCDYSLLDILETPGAPALLENKAAAGATVRLMIASLQSQWLTLDDWPPETRRGLAGEGPLTQALRQAHKRLWHLDQNTKIEARQVLTPRCPAILRFDDDMLIAIPLWGQARPRAPLIHLHRRQQNGLFDKFTNHFDALWETGWTIDPDPGARAPEAAGAAAYPGPHDPSAAEPNNNPTRRPTLTPYGRRQPHHRPR